MTDIPRLAWPLTLQDGGLRVVEQDSDDDIRQCITAILLHRIGDRVDVPAMGIEDPTFNEIPLELDGIESILDRHEPRASVLLRSDPDLIDGIVAEIHVEWQRARKPQEP